MKCVFPSLNPRPASRTRELMSVSVFSVTLQHSVKLHVSVSWSWVRFSLARFSLLIERCMTLECGREEKGLESSFIKHKSWSEVPFC